MEWVDDIVWSTTRAATDVEVRTAWGSTPSSTLRTAATAATRRPATGSAGAGRRRGGDGPSRPPVHRGWSPNSSPPSWRARATPFSAAACWRPPIEGGIAEVEVFANLFLTAVANATFYVLSPVHSGLRAYSRRYLEAVDLEATPTTSSRTPRSSAQGSGRGCASARSRPRPAISRKRRRSGSGGASSTDFSRFGVLLRYQAPRRAPPFTDFPLSTTSSRIPGSATASWRAGFGEMVSGQPPPWSSGPFSSQHRPVRRRPGPLLGGARRGARLLPALLLLALRRPSSRPETLSRSPGGTTPSSPPHPGAPLGPEKMMAMIHQACRPAACSHLGPQRRNLWVAWRSSSAASLCDRGSWTAPIGYSHPRLARRA